MLRIAHSSAWKSGSGSAAKPAPFPTNPLMKHAGKSTAGSIHANSGGSATVQAVEAVEVEGKPVGGGKKTGTMEGVNALVVGVLRSAHGAFSAHSGRSGRVGKY